VLSYILLGPRVPAASPSDPFLPSSFISVKYKLATSYAFLPLVWSVAVEAQESQTRAWAIRALGEGTLRAHVMGGIGST
jgi:hypothetical protein